MRKDLETFKRSYTDQELLDDLKRVGKELAKDKVTVEEYYEKGKFHNTTLRRRFGNWFVILEKAGLQNNIKQYDIAFCKSLGIEKGGKCLSNEFVKLKSKLEWECNKGHKFTLEPSKILSRNYWCPECTGRMGVHTIKSIQEIAQQRGWKFLSNDYSTGAKKYKFQCDKGHIINMIAHNVIKGVGCRTCAGKQLLTIEDFQKIAIEKGGKCLSEKYEGRNIKLKFKCKEGHTFETIPGEIKNGGAWCKNCAGLELGTIEEMIALAKSRGGECLSKEYINSATKLKWKCIDNHIWEAIPRDVKHSKSWCPYCTWYIGERKCKYILEKVLNTEFVKTRRILKSKLELDGYSKKYNLAFEFNGEQHYQVGHYFNNDVKKFEHQKRKDETKFNECKLLGISLIIIPHNEFEDDIQLITLIKKELEERNIAYENIEVDLMKDFYLSNSILIDISKLVASKGGIILSHDYKNNQYELKLKCQNGHNWEITYNELKKNKKCPNCFPPRKRAVALRI